MPDCGFDLFEHRVGDLACRRAGQAARVERTELEAKENRLHGQAALRRRNSNVRRIIARDVLPFGADDHGHDEWQAIDCIGGNHQNRPLPGLFPALNWVQVDEVNLAALVSHQCLSSPSASALANSTLMPLSSRCISGSAAIAASSASQVSRMPETATR